MPFASAGTVNCKYAFKPCFVSLTLSHALLSIGRYCKPCCSLCGQLSGPSISSTPLITLTCKLQPRPTMCQLLAGQAAREGRISRNSLAVPPVLCRSTGVHCCRATLQPQQLPSPPRLPRAGLPPQALPSLPMQRRPPMPPRVLVLAMALASLNS
jgi:hypothetical protein